VKNQPIAVFDSGVGGLSILRALQAELPHEDFLYFADSQYAPYGERSSEWVAQRSLALAQQLLAQGAKALVVACNTATAEAIALLRQRFPTLPMVGIEPALRPAASATITRHIGVLATERTLLSEKFRLAAKELDALKPGVHLALCAATGLALAIETANDPLIDTLLDKYLATLGSFGPGKGEIDTLVLGCTHYPLVATRIAAKLGPHVAIIDNGAAVARQTRRVLTDAGCLRLADSKGEVTYQASSNLKTLLTCVAR
jgi:glutamate racemase